ncbi:unnamed protein product [Thelazia callipaeda]|uniref:Epithelial membrane protein 2 n=1 Tax=Thelazia callipaeda TaxID=103827 RepID=A0A0N5D5W5_THECL|nr:unnamed protein product [Thelazia callipaeda]
MFLALLITLAALLTPNWRAFTLINGKEKQAETYSIPATMGLIWCDSQPQTKFDISIDYCKIYWNDKPEWERVVTALVIAATSLEVISLIWVAITFCACSCRQFWILFLPLTASLTTILLAFAVFIYTQNNNSAFEILDENQRSVSQLYHTDFSYSYYLACAAIVLTVISAIIGAFARKLAETCC